MKAKLALALIAAVGLAGIAASQTAPHGHGVPTVEPDPPSTKAFKVANDKMHQAMMIAYTGDADVDFVLAMIPHHQGAIEMAKVALQFGKDEQIRKLAADVVREQEREIGEMRAWLKKMGK
jgi:uncharacterized protein (DUF305 family)